MGKDGGERVWGWGEGLNVNVGRLLKRSRDHRQAAQEIGGSSGRLLKRSGDHRLIAGMGGSRGWQG